MAFIPWLMGLLGVAAVRVVVALGFSTLTFTGVLTLVNTLVGCIQANWSGLPLKMIQLLSLYGIPEALGIIAGAFVARTSMWAVVNGVRYVMRL